MALLPGLNVRHKDNSALFQDGALRGVNGSMCFSLYKRRSSDGRGKIGTKNSRNLLSTTENSFPPQFWKMNPCQRLNSCVAFTRSNSCLVMCSSESKGSSGRRDEQTSDSGELKAMEGLESLNTYLHKINKGTRPLCNLKSRRIKNVQDYQSFQEYEDHEHDEIYSLYLLGILAAINIGVFLFEAASPVKNSNLGLVSIPLLYGSKMNDLILDGEWWRLVTPMFLHSGILHLSLSCWCLLTFGPPICRDYGSFTFVLIYVIGGIYGNLTSFFHTPSLTVGGTGPAFGVIGAWLIYQFLSSESAPKHVEEESLFEKAVIFTGLSFILSHFGPIDDWTHLGAVLAGIAFGFFTFQLNSSHAAEEGDIASRKQVDPRKSSAVFLIFVLFSIISLLLCVQGPVGIPMSETADLLYSII